jgi:ribonuclease Y
VDKDVEGTHTELSVELCRKHGESEPVIQAIASHHRDVDFPSIEAVLVQSADTLSAARPGARRELLETYIKRLEKLEGLAKNFEGVSKAYALQAGREIRIMVEAQKVSDDKASLIAKDIATKIKNELDYPGQIKVTVIREMRAVEYAR